MDLTALADTVERITPVHPALDLVGDTVYVTVRVPTTASASSFSASTSSSTEALVLTSTGKVLSAAEWERYCRTHGLHPLAEPHLDQCPARWSPSSLRATMAALQHQQHLHPQPLSVGPNSRRPRKTQRHQSAHGDADSFIVPTFARVYTDLHTEFTACLEMSDPRQLVVLTLYCMMTYFHPLFPFLPILHLRGPAESGKSRAAECLSHVSFNALPLGAATEAVLMRTAHEGRYTQILTEGDFLRDRGSGDSLVRKLQAGCCRAEATVAVAEGTTRGGYTPRHYQLFCPRVILSTTEFGSQPLRSRCVRLDLVKSVLSDPQKLQKLRRPVPADAVWAPYRDDLYQLLLLRWRDVQTTAQRLAERWTASAVHDTSSSPSSNAADGRCVPAGRVFDKWLPLMTIAQLVGPEVVAVVEELIAEDTTDAQQDAAERDEVTIIWFALWLVRDGDRKLGRQELHALFLEEADGRLGDERRTRPAWAVEMEVSLTVEQARRVAASPDKLVKELQRLGLIGQARHHMTGNKHELNQAKIVDRAYAVLGAEEVQRRCPLRLEQQVGG